MVWIKICGVTSIEDALAVADAGADAIGLNFAPSSPRRIEPARAAEIVRAVGPRVQWVGVFVDAEAGFVEDTASEVGLDLLQLHGAETPEALRALGPRAFKAVRIGEPADVEKARAFAGDRLLVDSKVVGSWGGTGHRFDWSLLGSLPSERRVVLAGGLVPGNVEQAVRELRPFGVDTASGVESAPGKKDSALVREFVLRARAGSSEG
ncbi:MAG TPA: phosphoribosylanthranilate isomerase [Polyangiaceae bacterium]|nr:phosphoribosylanthranilate isomerase [Polyangiaceae bacterium]